MPLETPKKAMLKITLTEISNGFIVGRDGEHTYFETYGSALANFAPQASPSTKRKTK